MIAEDWEEVRRTVGKLERHPQLKEIIAKTRLGLENIYGERLEKLVLFGSQARGDARQDSDIDLLIVLKNPFDYSTESDRISYLIADICLEHTVVINSVFATLQKYQEYDGGLFRNIRQEGIPV
ncbi:MAG: nucleotidyltransferase domain-containing protein [Okeania sp. SIO3C4]|nr:nucleotidyltransferase domain-containing protein [Okeania sp. SIO3C4]